MNASLPPEDELREEREEEVRQEGPQKSAPGIGLGAIFGWLAVAAVVAFLLLPLLQQPRVPAQRSAQAELERRQQVIEQAAREASDEEGLAAQR